MPHLFYFNARGLGAFSDIFGQDPFTLSPSEIVKRTLVAGYKPVLGQPRLDPWPQVGEVHMIEHRGQIFLVAMSQDEVEISVQEVKANV